MNTSVTNQTDSTAHLHEPLTPPEGPSRRSFLNGGLMVGLGLLLAGCQNKASYTRTASPVWPDQEGGPTNLFPSGWSRSSGVSGSNTLGSAPRDLPPQVPRDYYSVSGNVMPRSRWAGGGPIAALANPMDGIYRITIHHWGEVVDQRASEPMVARTLEGIRRYHIGRERGWADIGYHYVIDPSGRVWAARPLHLQGAHVKDHNEHNLGIMLLGNFDEQRPTGPQLATLNGFVPAQMQRYRIPLSRVHTHRELNPTACPGSRLQAYMNSARTRGGRFALNA